jgi:4-aminobutyrate aminotransferase
VKAQKDATARHLEISRLFEPRFLTQHVPIVWKAASGTTVVDVDGDEYLDFTSGILVANIGHSHPHYTAAVARQAHELLSCYDFFNEPRLTLAQRLAKVLPPNLNKLYLLTTGAEAVEAAVKLSRYFTGKREIMSFYMSFHGRTNFTLALGAKKTRKRGFGPFPGGVIHAPYAYCYRCPFDKTFPDCEYFCVDHLNLVYDSVSADDVAALLIEPYQGAGGVVVPPPGYLSRIERWCRERDILMIIDEVQSGFGRTGKLFAFQHDNVTPDLLCLGKGLTSGIPGSAVVGSAAIMDGPEPGSMSTTYAGNPLAATAALAVLDILEEEQLVNNAAILGELALRTCREMLPLHDFVGDVRGQGLVLGLEIVTSKIAKTPDPVKAKMIVDQCFSRGLLVLGPDGFYRNVVVLAPPLVIEASQLQRGLEIIADVLTQVASL